MTGLGKGLFLFLLLMCLFQNGSCNFYADILWGQCYAFCLTRLDFRLQQQAADKDFSPTKEKIIIKDCRRDRICKACLYVCGRPKNKYLKYDSCLSDCEEVRGRRKRAQLQESCKEACNFIQQSSQSKYGSCPASESIEEPLNICTVQCQRDIECDRMDKCCSNGCATVCHPPTESEAFPPKPKDLEFKVLHDGGVQVKFGERSEGDYVKPVVNVLRWWCPHMIDVRFLSTTKSRFKVKGLRPAVSCNFMVASANIHGSLGFTDPRSYRKKLVKPSAPENLVVVRNKIRGERVDVTIRWEPPLYLDGLTLDSYQILWSDGLPEVSPEYHRLRMNKKFVGAERNSATIPRLKPGTTYFVQVKGVVKWKGRFINGDPVSTYTKTDSPPRPAGLDNEESFPQPIAPSSNIYNVTVQEAIFRESQLTARVTWSVYPDSHVEKYMLYWTPTMCDGEAQHRKTQQRSTMEATTHKQEFLLYNLKSNCLYEIWLYTVNYYGDKDAGHRHRFQTPSCQQTKGNNLDNCPLILAPPESPKNLFVRVKLSANCNCQAVISWTWSDDSEDWVEFLVVYGPSRQPGGTQMGTIVYQRDPYQIQIPRGEHDACMTHLEAGRHYTVQITSLANSLQSKPAVVHFKTPYLLTSCDMAPSDLPIDEDSHIDDYTEWDDIEEKMDSQEEGYQREDNQKAVEDPDADSSAFPSYPRAHLLAYIGLVIVVVILIR